jgi:predicted DNA binding CopG/RHH family protein
MRAGESMSRRKLIPRFKSEAEEIEFWETHDPDDYFSEPADDIIWDVKPEKKRRITLRIEPSVVAELKALAEKHSMPYQTLARGLIKRGIRELQEAE